MTGWNLPPGCTDRMVDEAFGEGRRGVYRVTVTRTSEITVEVQASSQEDAEHDGLIAARKALSSDWGDDDYDIADVEGPPERDPDDERDSRADYEYERNR